MTPRENFVGLIKSDILRMDLAELDFGNYRILEDGRDDGGLGRLRAVPATQFAASRGWLLSIGRLLS